MKSLLLHKLQSLSIESKLPHAWLLTGADEAAKLDLVKQFSQWLLCADKQQASACGSCKYCKLFIAGNHPDFITITPQESNSILADDVRRLNDFMVGSAHFGAKKIILLYPAEKMNQQASNALLKNLEEPSDNTVFFLLVTHVNLLLPTIVSRCQVLRFGRLDAIDIADPAEIIAWRKDLYLLWVTKAVTQFELIDKWLKQGQNEVLYWFELVLADLIKCRYTKQYKCLEQSEINSKIPISKLWLMLERVQQARRYFAQNYNPNLQLILEDLLLI